MNRSEAAKKAIIAAGGITELSKRLSKYLTRKNPDNPTSPDRAFYKINAWQKNGIPATMVEWMSRQQDEVSRNQMYSQVFWRDVKFLKRGDMQGIE